MKEAEVTLVDPNRIERNPDNPRLIFREEDMIALQESISEQGILVPLSVYLQGSKYRLIDGERRWKSALKLGMPRVPVLAQGKPERLANIMMMFAIHHARKDWDPLPTALKLEELEKEYQLRNGKAPTEKTLAGLASMSRGEVRRLKKLLALPDSYRQELLNELEKPRTQQALTVDHVLEATTAAAALRKRKVIDAAGEDALRRSLIRKFRERVITNTVAPRKLAKIARAVGRNELRPSVAAEAIARLTEQKAYTIDDAFKDTVEQVDSEHNLVNLVERVNRLLDSHQKQNFKPSVELRRSLEALADRIRQFIR